MEKTPEQWLRISKALESIGNEVAAKKARDKAWEKIDKLMEDYIDEINSNKS